MARMGMAIDLRRCAGCYACVVACQMQNNTKPGVAWGKVDAKEWGEHPNNQRCYVPHACMHCEDAPCVNSCPTGASRVRPDGIVVIDYAQCINCGACLHACPYGARVQNDSTSNYFDTVDQAPYEAEGVQRTGVVEKCIFCAGRVDAGLEPACVQNCPGKARVFGDLDDPASAINAFVAKNDPTLIRKTSFSYKMVEGMQEGSLPQPQVTTLASKGVDSRPAEPGIPLPIAIGGVVVAAAAGAGICYGVKNSKKKAALQSETLDAQSGAVNPGNAEGISKGGEGNE